MEIDEETFAGPSVEQFAKGCGSFHRLLNLNEVGSWNTLWIVFLVSFEIPYPGWGNKGAGVESTWPKGPCLFFGIGSSAAGLPYLDRTGEFEADCGNQWMAGFTQLSATHELALDSGGVNYGFRTATWGGARKNGVNYTLSGGQYTVHMTQAAPSVRRPVSLTITRDAAAWKLGVSVPSVWSTMADVTKQDCKDWLLGYSNTTLFNAGRPSGNSYPGSGGATTNMEPGTYGELDTIFCMTGKFPLLYKLHGVWGRVFPTIV